MATQCSSYLRKFSKLGGKTKGYVPLGIVLTDFDHKPIQYVITNNKSAAKLTELVAQFANNVLRPEFMAKQDEGWGEEGVLYYGIGMFGTWQTRPGDTLAPYGHFAITLIEAAAVHGVYCTPPSVPTNYAGCCAFGDLDSHYESYIECLVEELRPATQPASALLLSKRLAEGYEKMNVPPGGLSPINVPPFGQALKQCLDAHFKEVMPKAPAPLSFDNAFTAKLPTLVAPTPKDKPILVLHVNIRDLPYLYYANYAPPKYLDKLIRPPWSPPS